MALERVLIQNKRCWGPLDGDAVLLTHITVGKGGMGLWPTPVELLSRISKFKWESLLIAVKTRRKLLYQRYGPLRQRNANYVPKALGAKMATFEWTMTHSTLTRT